MPNFKKYLLDFRLDQESSKLVTSFNGKQKLIHKAFETFSHLILRFYCTVKVYNQVDLPTTSFILCSNHCSHLDSAVLMVASQLPFNQFGMIAAKDYFFKKNHSSVDIFRYVMNLLPIERKSTRKSILHNLRLCYEFTKDTHRNLIMYPEGTRSTTGELNPLKLGPALIASELNLPIVPAYITGTFEALPKGKFFIKPKKISIWFGKAILPKMEADTQIAKAHYRQLTQELEQAIVTLREQAQ